MKLIFSILFSVAVFYSCSVNKNLIIHPEKMDFGFENPEFLVNGTVTQSFSYCGGMRPREEDYYEMTRAKPLSETFYIRKGLFNDCSEKIIDTIVSDADGKFSVRLPKGDYCIIAHDHLDSSYVKSIFKNHSKPNQYYSAADTNCLWQWLKSPLVSFKLDSVEKISISWNIHNPCSWDNIPCVSYFGPLPP